MRQSTRVAAACAGLSLAALPALAQHTVEQGVAQNVDEIVLFGVGGLVLIFLVVFSTVASMVNRSNRERTRRELAAYVAEGSMTPQDAERILTAEPKDE